MTASRILVVDDEADNRRSGGARVRILLPLGDSARSAGVREPRKGEHRRERV